MMGDEDYTEALCRWRALAQDARALLIRWLELGGADGVIDWNAAGAYEPLAAAAALLRALEAG